MKIEDWMKRLFLAGISLAILSPEAGAQFHAKSQQGQTSVNQNAVQQARQQAAAMNQDVAASLSGGDVILPEEQRQALSKWNPRISEMRGRNIDVWGRMIYHSDQSYTESVEDMKDNSLKQTTFSKNGVELQTRHIMLDAMDRPSEVLVYNGRKEFRYRGVLVYDEFGRFSEEQLHDADGTLIRRKVQEYTADGQKKPVRTWDYVANVPDDLKLIVTRESEDPSSNPRQAEPFEQPRRFFQSREKSESAEAAVNSQGAAPASQPAQRNAQEGRKGLNLGKIFGSKSR